MLLASLAADGGIPRLARLEAGRPDRAGLNPSWTLASA